VEPISAKGWFCLSVTRGLAEWYVPRFGLLRRPTTTNKMQAASAA